MKDVSFHQAWPDRSASYDYESTLFHQPDHLMLQRESGWIGFYAVDKKIDRVVASLYINVTGTKATTAVRSPFGSVECSAGISPQTLYDFLTFIDEKLSTSVSEAEIRLSPQAYAPETSAWTFSFLHALGFTTIVADLSACIAVGGDYKEALHKGEQQVLHKALQAGLTASLISEDQMGNIYSFIAHHHNKKDYGISMTWPQLNEAISRFPGRYLPFAVHAEGKMVAAAIAIRVSSRVLSLFYIDHDADYDKLSPPVLLIATLYDYCVANHLLLLDLGTSSLPTGPNLSLLSFKMRMGAAPSIKATLRKVYRHG